MMRTLTIHTDLIFIGRPLAISCYDRFATTCRPFPASVPVAVCGDERASFQRGSACVAPFVLGVRVGVGASAIGAPGFAQSAVHRGSRAVPCCCLDAMYGARGQ